MDQPWQAELDAAVAKVVTESAASQEYVPGRVCHIDGDYLAYFCAGGDGMPIGTARHVTKERIDNFASMSGASKTKVHLTLSGSTKAERFLISTIKPYQGQRKGHHPKNWAGLREFLELHPYHSHETVKWADREADDGLALAAYSVRDPIAEVVHATRDKDMRMLPGTHLGWLDYTLTHVPRGAYEVVGPWDGLVYGTKWFWLQMLQGDGADYIPGLEKFQGKNIADETAAKLLAGTTCNEEAFEVVSTAYEGTYEDSWADRFVEQAGLLWLRTDSNATLKDMLRVVPCSSAILRAILTLNKRVKTQRESLNKIAAYAAAQEDDQDAGEPLPAVQEADE